MTKIKDNEIRFPHLIVCEGLDAKLFMVYYLQFLIKQDSRFEQFQVMDAGGITELRLFIKTLPHLPYFDKVKSITIARDCENNAKGANQSVQELLKQGFAVPEVPCTVALPTDGLYNVKTAYILFPKLNSDETNGTLEDLCLETLACADREIVLNIVDNTMLLYQEQFTGFKRPHKNRLHTYLSLSDVFVGLKIGESANANAFDFSVSIFKPLVALLNAMFEE